MSEAAPNAQDTATALAEAIAAKSIPAAMMDRAKAILEQLDKPLKVSVMGMPWSGKSGVVNLLAGENVLPDVLRGATVEFTYGEMPRASITRRDGSTTEQIGLPDMYKIGMESPAFVAIELPLPALRKITLLELAMPTEQAHQARALRWAAKRTDIAIWCTEHFPENEQSLWETVPLEMKDHAILLRTKIDTLGEDRAAALDKVSDIASDDFAFVLAFSAREALAAQEFDGEIDKELLRASGGMSLISTVLRQINRGQQNALDQAEFILLKADVSPKPNAAPIEFVRRPAPLDDGSSTEPIAETVETPRPEVAEDLVTAPLPAPTADLVQEPTVDPVVEPVEDSVQPAAVDPGVETVEDPVQPAAVDAVPEPIEDAVQSVAVEAEPEPVAGPVHAPDADAVPEPVANPVLAPEAVAVQQPESAPVPAMEPAPAADEKAILAEAVDRISAVGVSIQDVQNLDEKSLFNRSIETLDWVSDSLSDSQTYEDLRDIAMDASDTMQLMKIEAGEDGVEEAVCLMLQLKRAFQSELMVA